MADVPGEPRYEAKQALRRAMTHLRDAEDIARLQLRDDVFAGRIREVHETLTADVLDGNRHHRSRAWRARAWDRLRVLRAARATGQSSRSET